MTLDELHEKMQTGEFKEDLGKLIGLLQEAASGRPEDRYNCARLGCSNDLRNKRRGARYCSQECQHIAYQQRRFLRTEAGAALIAGETHDGNNVNKLKEDPLVTHVTMNIRLPRKLKLRLHRAASQAGVTQERFLNELLDEELPPL